jgi:hypothetical protein
MPVGEFRRAARAVDDLLETPHVAGQSTGLTSTDWQPLPSCLEWD